MYVMTSKMFSEERPPKAGRKDLGDKIYWNKIFLLKHIVRLEHEKNCINKLSIKMFIKNKAV